MSWVPTLRQRIAAEPSTSIHSHVARPSGSLQLQVISQMPSAPSTFFTRIEFGHGFEAPAAARSAASTKPGRTLALNVS